MILGGAALFVDNNFSTNPSKGCCNPPRVRNILLKADDELACFLAVTAENDVQGVKQQK
jgi:hypothetical protein